jgi:sodium-dependent dicarboxylate transporter 2/3/5
MMLLLAWLFLSFFLLSSKKQFIPDIKVFKKQYQELGKMSYEEKIVFLHFILLAFLWIFRTDITIGDLHIPGWSRYVPFGNYLNDGTVAIFIAVILFIIPSKENPSKRILAWDSVSQLPWDIILLFGGGFALAAGFKKSGLAEWFGKSLHGLDFFHPIFLIALICLLITFLTELTSNTATAEILLPIIAAVAVTIKVNPLLLMIPATISCSFAFMLPVATPPNAIVFGTKRIRMIEMAKTGFLLNFLGILVVTLIVYFLGSFLSGTDLSQFPDWAL